MRLHVHSSTRSLLLSYTPELLESPRALNGWSICASGNGNVVGSTIGRDSALGGRPRAGVVRAKVLNNVVFNERVGGPAVNGQIGVAVRRICAGVFDCAGEYSKQSYESSVAIERKSYRALPVFQPLPPTKFPPDFHDTE